MSDVNLLAFGCTVTFIAIAGAYVILRERLAAHDEPDRAAPAPQRVAVVVDEPLSRRAAG